MRLHNLLISLVCFIVGMSLLFVASTRLDTIHQDRVEMGLVSNPELDDAPPSLMFATIAMGAFRGLVVDILWMRADELKQRGLFFDAKQLAEWITVLQPRFASVWGFHAWNMAYNISVMVPADQWQERWRWVKNGYELLRDKGIVINPHAIILYRELAWIFQHKMGHVNDDCHRYYKRELAMEMRPLLGNSPTNEQFERLTAAPKEFEQVAGDEKVAAFIDELKTSDKAFDCDQKDFVGNYLALRQTPKKFSDKSFAVIDKYRDTETLNKFDLFAKAYQLRNVWKFDIAFMCGLNERYGPVNIDDPNDREPLNWEHPDAHAIYWAELGLKVAGKPGEYSVDEKNTDRIVFQSLQSLYRRGEMIIYDVPGREASVFLRPDLRMFDSCNDAWQKRFEKYSDMEGSNPKAVRGGHRHFLENSVELFYRAGYRVKAARVYQQLRDDFSDGPHSNDRFRKLSMVEFVRTRVREEFNFNSSISDKDAGEQIIMSLKEAYFRYAVGQDNLSAAAEAWAREIYRIYQEQTGLAEEERMGLPSLEFLRYQAFGMFLGDPLYPDRMKNSLMARIQIEKPDLLEQLQKTEQELLQKLRETEPEPDTSK